MCGEGAGSGSRCCGFHFPRKEGTRSAAGGRGRSTALPTVSREGAVLPDVAGMVEKRIRGQTLWGNLLTMLDNIDQGIKCSDKLAVQHEASLTSVFFLTKFI